MTTPQLIKIIGGLVFALWLVLANVIMEGELIIRWYEQRFGDQPLIKSPRRSRIYRIVLFVITLPLLPFKTRTAHLKTVRYEN